MKDIKAIFFDFEVFKYDWLVCITEWWLDENNQMKTKDLVIVNNRRQLIEYYEANKDNGIFIGKNSSRYDNGIMVGILENKNPKQISDAIIEKDISWKTQIKNWRKYKFLYIDIMQDAARISLKEEEAYLDLPIITTEVEFDTDRLLTKEELEKSISYCKADVRALITSFKNNIDGIITKINLILEYNLPKNYISMTNAQLCAKLFECKKTCFDDEFEPFDVSCLGIKPQNTSILNFYSQPIDYKNKLNITLAGVPHTYAFGGLHGALANVFINEELWLLDVASYYPTLMIYYNFLSRAMPLSGKRKFVNMYFNRRKVKARNGKELLEVINEEKTFYKDFNYYGDYDSTYNDSLDIEHHKADKKKSQVLKLPLNTTYGCEKAKYNDMYDPHNSNNVCISGQLMLTALIEMLEPYCKLIQSNTDGIIIIPYNKDKIREIVSEWEKASHMTMELDIAHKLIQKDVNNYILYVDNNNDDTNKLIEECAKIGIKVEIMDLLSNFKNVYNKHKFITNNKEILNELSKDIPTEILDKYYLKHLNFYTKLDNTIYINASSIKVKGGFTAQYIYGNNYAAGAQIRSSLSVIDDCVCNYFLFDIPITETLNYTKENFKTRFKQVVKSGPSFNRNVWFKDGKHIPIGKINRVYATTDPTCGGVFKINDKAKEKKTGNIYSQIVKFQDTSDKTYVDNDLTFDFDNLDLNYYAILAENRINQYKSKERIK
jgi:hypothetical protein